jgi:hypothetical protein
LIAVTRPARFAGTIVIDAARLVSDVAGTICTFSPRAKLIVAAPRRRSVMMVAALIEYVFAEPVTPTTVMVELESDVTSPPMPPGPRGGIGGGGVALASFELRAAGGLTVGDACVAALATPMPLASTVTAIAEERPTFRRARFRDNCFIGDSLSVSTGGNRNEDIFSNECVEAIGKA